MDNVPSISKWKKMFNKAINLAVETQWREDISSRSSLKYINSENVKSWKGSSCMVVSANNLHDSRSAQLKSRILTYRAIVQSSASLQLTPPANFVIKVQKPDKHFLAECQTLHHVRHKFFSRIQHIVERYHIPARSDPVNTWLKRVLQKQDNYWLMWPIKHLHQRRFRRIYLSTNPSPHDPQNLLLAQTNRPMKTPGRIFSIIPSCQSD